MHAWNAKKLAGLCIEIVNSIEMLGSQFTRQLLSRSRPSSSQWHVVRSSSTSFSQSQQAATATASGEDGHQTHTAATASPGSSAQSTASRAVKPFSEIPGMWIQRG